MYTIMKCFENITIVLVNPSHPGNIGAVARAMKTMNVTQLRLVKPRRAIDEEAFARSAGAENILHEAKYFEELIAAIADCHLVIGTSARPAVPDVIGIPFHEAAALASAAATSQRVALVFGREHAGLTNEELALCQYHAYIPANSNFNSLNLGAAVQVMCYELYKHFNTQEDSKPVSPQLSSQQEIAQLFEHFAKTLHAIEFYDPQNPRRLLPKLRALFNRTHLLKSEVAILRGILTAVDKKI